MGAEGMATPREQFSHSRGVFSDREGAFFLRKKALGIRGLLYTNGRIAITQKAL
jgi:hypothetical protein